MFAGLHNQSYDSKKRTEEKNMTEKVTLIRTNNL